MLTLVEVYEARHHALPPGDPIEVLGYKLRELGISQRELARRLGWSSGRVSEVLNRRRNLTLAMVRQLAAVLGISAGLLVGEESVPTASTRSTAIAPALLERAESAAQRAGWSLEAWLEHAIRAQLATRRSTVDVCGTTSTALPPWRLRYVAGLPEDQRQVAA